MDSSWLYSQPQIPPQAEEWQTYGEQQLDWGNQTPTPTDYLPMQPPAAASSAPYTSNAYAYPPADTGPIYGEVLDCGRLPGAAQWPVPELPRGYGEMLQADEGTTSYAAPQTGYYEPYYKRPLAPPYDDHSLLYGALPNPAAAYSPAPSGYPEWLPQPLPPAPVPVQAHPGRRVSGLPSAAAFSPAGEEAQGGGPYDLSFHAQPVQYQQQPQPYPIAPARQRVASALSSASSSSSISSAPVDHPPSQPQMDRGGSYHSTFTLPSPARPSPASSAHSVRPASSASSSRSIASQQPRQPAYDFSHAPYQPSVLSAAPAPALSLPSQATFDFAPPQLPRRSSAEAATRAAVESATSLSSSLSSSSSSASIFTFPLPGSSSSPASDAAPTFTSAAQSKTDGDAEEEDASLLPLLSAAAQRRRQQSALPSPLAYKPARGVPPATAASSASSADSAAARARQTRREELAQLERGRVARNQQGSVTALERLVVCGAGAGCGRRMGRVVLRGMGKEMVGVVEDAEQRGEAAGVVQLEGEGSRCWACLGAQEGRKGVVRAGAPLSAAAEEEQGTAKGKGKGKQQTRTRVEGKGYDDTLSAAIDRLEGLQLSPSASSPSVSSDTAGSEQGKPTSEEDWEGLLLAEDDAADGLVGTGRRAEVLKCDVCTLTVGLGRLLPSPSLSAAVPASSVTKSPLFTVETICLRCDALFKCCSDCGGGGGRLTPGRWRSRELFPEGRKTCKLSHARNPALGQVTVDVHPLSPTPPASLPSFVATIRRLYWNSRIGVIARPEFLLRGDGLARSFDEVEKVTVDHWALLERLLDEQQPDESTGIKRYLTLMYSTPRKRHAAKSESGRKAAKEPERVAFGFAISVADFCCVMPWPINGQAFDAMTTVGETTTARVKSDLSSLNVLRAEAERPPYPELRFNFLVSPFKLDSRANYGLARRGYEPLEGLLKRDEGVRREWFPPAKEVWLPSKYAKALQVYVRPLVGTDDLGGPPTESVPRKRLRKGAARPAPTTATRASPIPGSGSEAGPTGCSRSRPASAPLPFAASSSQSASPSDSLSTIYSPK
ncbi:hypothetical protein JCM10213v2_006360 [Rhodosporidiobolus nylandii]